MLFFSNQEESFPYRLYRCAHITCCKIIEYRRVWKSFLGVTLDRKKNKYCFKIQLDFNHIMQCLHNIDGYYIKFPHFNMILLYLILLYLTSYTLGVTLDTHFSRRNFPIFIEIQTYFSGWIFEQNA